jgi:hypothetical protein
VWLALLGYAVFWVWALVALLGEKREGREIERLTWVIVLILLPVLGLILYAFLGPGAQEDREAAARRKPWESSDQA